MKTIQQFKLKVAVATIAILLGFGAVASNGSTGASEVAVRDAEKTIREHVRFPNLIQSNIKQEEVRVTFTVDEQGKVNLVIADTKNPYLKEALEKQFYSLTLKHLKANTAYGIMFNFKVI